MQKSTITVHYVNPPKEGKKLGSIKTTDGAYFGVYPEKLGEFTVGCTYNIEFTSREFNGKTFHTIKSATPVASAPGNGKNGHSNTGSTSDQIRWQTCLKVAGELYRGQGMTDAVLDCARKLFAADPIVEAAKEMFKAEVAAVEANGDDAPGDW